MDIHTFNWETGPNHPYIPREIITAWDVSMMKGSETDTERKIRMLKQLHNTCMACTMCELGRKDAEKGGICRDPHVLSSMTPNKIFICGQNPGYEELKAGAPFIGASGKNFDNELNKHHIDRSSFYITNIVRCFTADNTKPSQQCIEKCKPFILMEIGLLNPKLIVTLGAVSFKCLCPNEKYNESLGHITTSIYGVKVMAILHPSPLNLMIPERKAMFEKQIAMLCGLVKRIDSE